MQKTQMSSTLVRRGYLGFGAPSVERSLPCRQFHRSPRQLAEESPQAHTTDRSSYRPRVQDTTAETQHLYDRQLPNGQPLIRYNQRRQPAPASTSRSPRQAPSGALDLRSAAARPPASARTSTLQRPFDIRNSGANPSDIQQRLVRRSTPDGRPGPQQSPQRTSGTRDTRSQAQPLRNPRASLFRNRGGSPIGATFLKPPRGPAPRKGGNGARTTGMGGPRSFADMQTSERMESFMTKDNILRSFKVTPTKGLVAHQVPEVSADSLHGNGPAIPVAEWGMSEVVEEWVHKFEELGTRRREEMEKMVEKWKKGDYVAFGDREMKERVLDAVEHGIRDLGEEEQAAAAKRLREVFGTEFADTVFKGSYQLEGKQSADTLGSLARKTTLNPSFLPRDGVSLAAKVKALLPPAKAGGTHAAARA